MLKNEDISIIKNDFRKLLEEYCNKTQRFIEDGHREILQREIY